METKAISDDWVIARQDGQSESSKIQTCAMVWIANAPPSERLMQSAKTLSKTKNLFQGIHLTLKTDPEFGFIIESRSGWHLITDKQSEDFLEKVIWELNRISR